MEKKGKSTESENRFYLPVECMLEILLRLPVKPLLRFKRVSKKWFSLISNPKFVKSHSCISANRSQQIICCTNSQLKFIDPDALFHGDPPRTENQELPPQIMLRSTILSLCRGFLLLVGYTEFIVWNVSTGNHKQISYSHMQSRSVKCNLCDGYLYGLGYDASMDDYLIVVAWYEDSEESHLEYFSLRTNSWTKLEPLVLVSSMNPHLPPECKVGSFLNGALHWFGCVDNYDSIIAFDLKEKSFSMINIPETPAETVSADLNVVGGYLTMTYGIDGDRIEDDRIVGDRTELWVMKMYKVQSSWIKYELDRDFVKPIYLAECGDIVGLDSSGRVVKYNDEGELLVRSISPYCRYWDGIVLYNESMLLLSSHSEEAREDGQP